MILEPRQILTAGVPVLTADGRRGQLRQALLSPGHRRLHALVIRYGAVPPRDVVVPVEQVADITDVQVRLTLSRAELVQQPAYRVTALAEHMLSGPRHALVAVQYGNRGTAERIIEAPHDIAAALGHRRGNPADELLSIRAGQRVWSAGRRVGTLRHLIVDHANLVRELVVRVGSLSRRDVIVPIARVDRIDSRGVWLALDELAIEQLPRYQPDRAILTAVERALWADETIRRLDYRSISRKTPESPDSGASRCAFASPYEYKGNIQ